jgi:two-component system sensor histidine kinase TctE
MLVAELVPTLLVGLASVALTWVGVQRVLAPLDRLRKELLARDAGDLHPLPDDHAPLEIAPVLAAFNRVLGELREGSALQKRFLANAAHQLRTPIAGLMTQIELARGSDDAGKRDAHLANARESATRLTRLAQQVLSLAAADPLSNPGAPTERVDLSEIVTSHADEWLRMTRSTGAELEFDLSAAPISGNAVLVGELATNLVHNAARYGARGVTVATRAADRTSSGATKSTSRKLATLGHIFRTGLQVASASDSRSRSARTCATRSR